MYYHLLLRNTMRFHRSQMILYNCFLGVPVLLLILSELLTSNLIVSWNSYSIAQYFYYVHLSLECRDVHLQPFGIYILTTIQYLVFLS